VILRSIFYHLVNGMVHAVMTLNVYCAMALNLSVPVGNWVPIMLNVEWYKKVLKMLNLNQFECILCTTQCHRGSPASNYSEFWNVSIESVNLNVAAEYEPHVPCSPHK
jgi:hypothetical protein